MAREPSAPSFLTKNLTPVQARDLDIEADMREAMAEVPEAAHYRGDPYAPKRNGAKPPEIVNLVELERLTARPLYSVAVAVSELRFHDAIEFAQGVITKSDALKAIPPHELAMALNGWSLQARTNEVA